MSSPEQHEVKEVQSDKENVATATENVVINTMNPPPQPSSQRSAGKGVRDCPQTPVGRLPLSQLLANSDDACHHLDLTPIERVLWDNSPLSSVATSSTRKGKKRKRAHSSSPASSSQNQSSNRFAGRKVPAKPPALQEVLKTPKADLVDDLWSRYSLHTTDKRSPTAPFNVEFPQLTHSSSPALDPSSRENTGLRRAFSCIDWPTSAAKRRNLRISSREAGAVADLAKFDKPLDSPFDSVKKTKSRVSLLVERIQDHLANPAQRQEFSCSDPGCSPVASDRNSPAKDAPVDRYSQAQVDGVATTSSQAAMGESRSNIQPLVLPAEDIAELNQDEGSSDFDDDDLDMGMIEALSGAVEGEKAQIVGELRSSESSDHILRVPGRNDLLGGCVLVEENKSAQLTNVKSSTEVTPRMPTLAAPPQQHDEFDDDEEDITAAELEGVFAKYDTQLFPHTAPDRANVARKSEVSKKERSSNDANGKSHKKPVMTIEVLSDDDDDFGRDSDFEQIAAEVAASQTQQSRSQAKASVCSTHHESSV